MKSKQGPYGTIQITPDEFFFFSFLFFKMLFL